MIHELKTWPNAFAGLRAGLKTHECRRWDREFEIGHVLKLREWDPQTKEYTGEYLWREITWITDPSTYGMTVAIEDPIVVMSVRPCHAPIYTEAEGLDVPHDHRD